MRTLSELIEQIYQFLKSYDYDEEDLDKFHQDTFRFVNYAIHSDFFDSPTQATIAYLDGKLETYKKDADFIRFGLAEIINSYYKEYREYQQRVRKELL